MDIKELLNAVPDILKYGIPGFSVILLFFSFLLLKKESEKENSSPTIIKSIKFYLYISATLIILFLTFELLSKMVLTGKWTIQGDIELRDNENIILHDISKDKCGDSLEHTLSINQFLETNLNITLLPNLPYKSFASKSFTANIPENIHKEVSKIFFDIDGFSCVSNTCQIELNASNYNPEIKLIFMQNKTDEKECLSSDVNEHSLTNG